MSVEGLGQSKEYTTERYCTCVYNLSVYWLFVVRPMTSQTAATAYCDVIERHLTIPKLWQS